MARPPQLPALTSIRFFAAFWVVVFHVSGPYRAQFPGWLANIVNTSYVGVGFFFVLSGFILTYTYGSEASETSRRKFWIARFARIYPIYAVALVLSFVFAVEGFREAETFLRKGVFGLTFGLAPALLQSWIPSCAGRWNAPGWSLSVEAFFYALFPFVLIRLMKCRTSLLMPCMVGLWALACSTAGLYLILKPDGIAHPDIYSSSIALTFVKFHPLVRLPEFLLGMTLCRYYQTTKDRCSFGFSLAVVAAALIAVVLIFSDKIPMPLLHDGLVDPLLCLLIYGLATARYSARKILELPLLVLLGEASYTIYILQWPIVEWLRRLGVALGVSSASFPLWTAMSIVVVVATSVASFKFFETPMRRYIVSRFQAPVPAPTPALYGLEATADEPGT